MYVAVQWQAAVLIGTRVLGSLVLCCCVKQRAACWCDIEIKLSTGLREISHGPVFLLLVETNRQFA